MRSIKFRAWDKYANKMRLVKSINYADDGFAKTILVHLVGGINGGYVHGESCELMQYTGLTDHNGKEIYEGDILRYTFGGKTKVDAIEFQPPIFTYRNSMRWSLEQDEVIGNVYEHPELLTEVSGHK